jgi:hypothetical protein
MRRKACSSPRASASRLDLEGRAGLAVRADKERGLPLEGALDGRLAGGTDTLKRRSTTEIFGNASAA